VEFTIETGKNLERGGVVFLLGYLRKMGVLVVVNRGEFVVDLMVGCGV
jgi:hypothetical protein